MALKYRSTAVFLKPDVRFKSKLVAKTINCVMRGGKKSVAEKVVYQALDIIKSRIKEDEDPLTVFETAIENIKPGVEVRSKRVGGATYQVPMPVEKARQQTLALRWLLAAVRSKKGKPMAQRLADELMDACNRQGGAMTVRDNTHRMAEANKAFAHFAW